MKTTTDNEIGPEIFKWMMKHQDAIDALKDTQYCSSTGIS